MAEAALFVGSLHDTWTAAAEDWFMVVFEPQGPHPQPLESRKAPWTYSASPCKDNKFKSVDWGYEIIQPPI